MLLSLMKLRMSELIWGWSGSSVSFSWRCSSRSTCTWTTRSATSWMARPTLTSGTRRTDGSASPWTRGTWSPCQPASTIASPWTRAYVKKHTNAQWGECLYGDARCWRSHLITSANVWRIKKDIEYDIEYLFGHIKQCFSGMLNAKLQVSALRLWGSNCWNVKLLNYMYIYYASHPSLLKTCS